jgi:menaquinone-dependent protoporphyrinogen oxidase
VLHFRPAFPPQRAGPARRGDVAQLGEHRVRIAGVRGSSPLISTTSTLMAMHVLVAFATKHGSTAEIAEAIGAVLREAGHEVDVRAARDVQRLSGYGAVVLGSALYAAHWQHDANRFVKRHLAALQRLPVWLFSSGPLDYSAEVDAIPLTQHVAPEVAPIGARDHRTFGGRLLEQTAADAGLLATHRIGDFRNWEHIRAWAHQIAETLASASPA